MKQRETRHKCSNCGKYIENIYDFSEYVYRKGFKFFCSWSCYNLHNNKKYVRSYNKIKEY